MHKILDVLADQWCFDIEILSQPWMYYWALVPAACYLAFFVVKWTFLTMPAWLPFAIVASVLKEKTE